MRPNPEYQSGHRLDTSNLRGYEVEALLRLSSARRVLDAILMGEWMTSTGVLDEVASLVRAASADVRAARLVSA